MRWPWKKGGYFTLVIHEPLGGEPRIQKVPIRPGQRLMEYLGENWRAGSYARQDGKPLGMRWPIYEPRAGQTIELNPNVGSRSFTEAFIEKLNAKTAGGKFIKTAILTVTTSPLVQRFFADHDAEVVFNGITYERIGMAWGDYEVSRRMPFPTTSVTVPNLGGEVIAYVETTPLLDHDIVLQLVHQDLLGDVTAKDERKFIINSIAANDLASTFNCGLNMGLQDRFPRERILRSEFPAIPETISKFE